ncbi:NYN domain-containing protein [Stomatobaculum longum]|jgi:hypothetical protein|uniref:NYN domain-containing protein n=1 Tax=Stomatobaculum longum TaxID=796942 RepID=UPI0028803E60|nr:NYN domain-containing protein [Stomatobaculum longum]
MIRTAIMIDGAFYRRRAYHFWGEKHPEQRAAELYNYCKQHIVKNGHEPDRMSLYRIFYYDAQPSSRRIFHPLLQRTVDLGKSDTFKWSNDFYQELRHQRKFALRLGYLASEQAFYTLREKTLKRLMNRSLTVDQLTEADFTLEIKQKSVDMMIGVDISSVAFKKQVDRIILIAGDSDFVPAAKQARREGVDFILDPMRKDIKPDLFEHIDGIRTNAPHERAGDTKDLRDGSPQ